MMTQEDFLKDIKKVSASRKHKIKKSVGINDFLKRSTSKLTDAQIRQIIKRVNDLMSDQLAIGKTITLPQQMGKLEVRKFDSFVKFENGELKTNRAIDWNRTLQLWFNDEEAKKNKTFVRTEDKKIFKIFYNRAIAKYNNKVFYEFKPNRTLKNKIKNNIRNGVLTDSFYIS